MTSRRFTSMEHDLLHTAARVHDCAGTGDDDHTTFASRHPVSTTKTHHGGVALHDRFRTLDDIRFRARVLASLLLKRSQSHQHQPRTCEALKSTS